MSDDGLPHLRRTPSPSRSTVSRKRSRGAASDNASNSSDGMFFSSDDLGDAGQENYAAPRHKKHFKRSWFQTENASRTYSWQQYRAEEKQRTKDSGVYMASDYSSSEDGFMLDPISSPPAQTPRRSNLTAASTAFTNHFLSRPQPKEEDEGERVVREAVDACLDRGLEVIDLTGVPLENVSCHALVGLKQLVRHPRSNGQSFESLKPQITIFMVSAGLRKLPTVLCELEDISVLSLRTNKLTLLPPAIGNLFNLTSLNVSANRLRWLPFELLNVIKDGVLDPEKLLISGNPLARPSNETAFDIPSLSNRTRFATTEELRHTLNALAQEDEDSASLSKSIYRKWVLRILGELLALWESVQPETLTPAMRSGQISLRSPSSRLPKQRPLFLDATAVSYFDRYGKSSYTWSPPAPSHTSWEQTVFPIVSKQASAGAIDHTSGRSLFATALNFCAQAENIEEYLYDFDEEHPVKNVIERAVQSVRDGNSDRACTTCGRVFLLPRAEWIEYWHIPAGEMHIPAYQDMALPFLRQVCSWDCATPSVP